MTKNHYMLISLILLGVTALAVYYFGYKSNPNYSKEYSMQNTYNPSTDEVVPATNTSDNTKDETPSNTTSTSVTATPTPTNEARLAINKCDLKQGWYYGSISQKKPGTPNDWRHEGEGLRSARWVAPYESQVPTAEEEAECDKLVE